VHFVDSLNITQPTNALTCLHEKQRTQIHDMLPQQYYNEILIFLTRGFS